MRSLVAWLGVVTGLGCSSETEPAISNPAACEPPNRVVADRCLEPGVQDNGCHAGTLPLDDGSCQPAGVPPELCADGFEPDGDAGCEPLLPAEICPPGQLAVPGETRCHELMPCGSGTWGDIPVDATTIYVDGSYAGTDSDGSAGKPWTTIAEAVVAAPTGALIAVAAGSYQDVDVNFKSVRLWGTCPQEVEIVGTSAAFGALFIRNGTSPTEIHGLAVTGATTGVVVSGVENVLLENVWVHGTAGRGINIQDTYGPTSLMLRNSLVEQSRQIGFYSAGAAATLERVVVRDTMASGPEAGSGVSVQNNPDTGARGSAVLQRSVIEQNSEVGVLTGGADVTIDGTVVRSTAPRESDGADGRGASIQSDIVTGVRSTALIRGSLFEANHDAGVLVGGSDATIEGTVFRDTQPQESNQLGGSGLSFQSDPTGARATGVARASLVADNHEAGLAIMASDVTLEGVLVRGTLPRPQQPGQGMGIAILLSCTPSGCDPTALAKALVVGSTVEQNHIAGVSIFGSDAELRGLLVRGTHSEPGTERYGDGVVVMTLESMGAGIPTNAAITESRIENNARAGLSTFGAHVALGSTALSCNTFDLGAEKMGAVPFTIDNLGANQCGCPSPTETCHAQSVGLSPPSFGSPP